MKQIGVGKFVLRQTADSRFSHFDGTWQDLERLVDYSFSNRIPGYREGVVLVPVPATGFYSGIVEINGTTRLIAKFEARREGEAKHIVLTALGEKMPAKSVEIVLYHRDVLLEEADAQVGEYEWEIVSINAHATEGAEPMNPLAMARNMLGMAGGTKADYSAQQFAEAIVYWSQHAMRGEVSADDRKRDSARLSALQLANDVFTGNAPACPEDEDNIRDAAVISELIRELQSQLINY